METPLLWQSQACKLKTNTSIQSGVNYIKNCAFVKNIKYLSGGYFIKNKQQDFVIINSCYWLKSIEMSFSFCLNIN
jgi:hypothetical protein